MANLIFELEVSKRHKPSWYVWKYEGMKLYTIVMCKLLCNKIPLETIMLDSDTIIFILSQAFYNLILYFISRFILTLTASIGYEGVDVVRWYQYYRL